MTPCRRDDALVDVREDRVDGRLDRKEACIDDEFGRLRFFVIAGDAGEIGQGSGAGLTVVTFRIAPFARRSIGFDVNFVERVPRRTARRGAIRAIG